MTIPSLPRPFPSRRPRFRGMQICPNNAIANEIMDTNPRSTVIHCTFVQSNWVFFGELARITIYLPSHISNKDAAARKHCDVF